MITFDSVVILLRIYLPFPLYQDYCFFYPIYPAGRSFFVMDDQVNIRNSDGIDFSLSLAGLGSRSYAFVVDWHIRILVVLLWLVGVLLIVGSGDFEVLYDYLDEDSLLLVILPPLIVYFFYHPVLEVLMHGQTPGKRMAGIRIVSHDGRSPTIGALLIRNIFRLVDSLPLFYTLGLMVTIFTKQQVRIGDMAAGTLLIHVEKNKQKSVDIATGLAINSTLSHSDQSLLLDILDRWNSLQPDIRLQLGQQFLNRIGDTQINEVVAKEFNHKAQEAEIFQRLQCLSRGESL